MSEFDAESFMGREVNEHSETTYVPIPEGEYTALVERVTPRGTTRNGSVILDVHWAVDDEGVREATGMDNPIARQTLFIDLENGAIAFGKNKNVQLGRLRAALGQNQDGMSWSPMMLVGAGPATVKIEQRVSDDDPDVIYTDVKRVVALS